MPNGSHPRDLTDHRLDDFSFWPDFSPDGETIAYTSVNLGFHIFRMNADGSKQTRLTGKRFDAATPTFSPNGRRIVFHARAWLQRRHLGDEC